MATTNPNTTARVALITGANKGIGFETAKQLGRPPHGVTVLIGARDLAKGKGAADALKREKIDARPIQLDVTDQRSIDAAAASIKRDFGRLDILINNAGVQTEGHGMIPSRVTQEMLRSTFDTNLFGLIAVTQAMLPLLRAGAAGRIVNLSSILGSLGEHTDPSSPIYNVGYPAYDASKAALNMFTMSLARELKGTAIKVNAAHPGWVKTDMGGQEAPMELADGARTSVMLATLGPEGPSGGFFHMGVHMRW